MNHKIKFEVCEIEPKNYHLFLTLKIGDKPCRLLIDTGASKTVFDAERVLQFVNPSKLKTHHSKSVGLGVTEMETQATKLKNIQIGKLHINKFGVAILPLQHVNQTYANINVPAIDGVLGSDFLMKYKAVINYKTGYLKLFSK